MPTGAPLGNGTEFLVTPIAASRAMVGSAKRNTTHQRGAEMVTRRQFMYRGLGAIGAGVWARRGLSWSLIPPVQPFPQLDPSDPVAPVATLPQSVMVNGFPFEPWFTGDAFREAGHTHLAIPPFQSPPGNLPDPDQFTTIAVVGGGLSGLTSAYLLRDLHPVLMDMHPRFGGAARGESWAATDYSLGNAYVITPDAGTFLEQIYTELGLPDVVKVDPGGADPVAVDGRVLEDFWTQGLGGSREEIAALEDYAAVVSYMADQGYPNIPFAAEDAAYVADLDTRSLKEDLEQRMRHAVPPLLASAIQGYCFSSFAAGWDQISAAGGWNFLAAEEYGRWVFPGGTSYLARALWRRLHGVAQSRKSGPPMLLPDSTALDVRLNGSGVKVTYRNRAGHIRALQADRVIMACPKFVCKHIMPDLARRDPEKLAAMATVLTTPYLVANVLLSRPIEREFYDIFLLGDSAAPLGLVNPCGLPFDTDHSPVTDALNGEFARPVNVPRSVLTLYWPLMCPTARYELVFQDPWVRWAERLAVQLDGILALVGRSRTDVVQVRMTRWGHAMPWNQPGLIAGGTIGHLRRPVEDKIYFVNQDNWALPAVENSMLDAELMCTRIREHLGR